MEFTIQELKQHYAQVCKEIEEFERKNEEILSEYEILKGGKEAFLEDIKEYARTNKEEIDLGDERVTVTTAYKKWIDYDAACEKLSQEQIVILDSMTSVKKEVDMKQFVDACREGVLPNEARIAAYKEEEMKPRVSVK